MDLSTVVRLVSMHRAAVAVAALIGISIDADAVDPQYPGVLEPHPDETGKIEHRMALARRGNEKQGILPVSLHEPLDEFVAHFVTVLADQGSDGGEDAAAFGAEFFHRVDRGFQNA